MGCVLCGSHDGGVIVAEKVSGRVSMAIVLSLASTPRRETCVIYLLALVDEAIIGQIGVNASPIEGLAGAHTSQVLDADSVNCEPSLYSLV